MTMPGTFAGRSDKRVCAEERQACADSGRSQDHDRAAGIDPKRSLVVLGGGAGAARRAADISRNLTVDRPVVGAARIGMNVSSGQMHQNDDSRGARRRGPSSLSRIGVVNCLPAAYAERDLLLSKARVGAIVA